MSTVVDDPTLQPAPAPEAPPAPSAPPAPEAPKTIAAAALIEEARPLTKEEIIRPAMGALSTTLGCAFMVGGMFTGITPRIFAAIGGMVGVAMAVWAARTQKRVNLVQALSLLGVVLIGIVLVAFDNFGAIGKLPKLIGEAATNAKLHKPPANFDPGWHAILPWTLGLIGYAAAWVGSVGRKAAVGLLVPLPVVAFAAIAQPSEAQIPAGIVAFVTFAIGLAVIYRADRGEGEGVSTAYELKRAMRTAPIVVLLIAGLIGASQLNLLFPEPIFDPSSKATLPKSIPLSAVKDRVLFTVKSNFTGPWRAGVLDVYDGNDFLIASYNDSSFTDAPVTGVIDEAFGQPADQQVRADLTIRGLDGTVMPIPARIHAISGTGLPKLVTDARSQTIRVKEGQVRDGLVYTVVFALLPTEDDLRHAGAPDDVIKKEFTDTANLPAPPSVAALIAKAPTKNLWDRLDYVRKQFVEVFTVKGAGLPSHVPPSKVEDMLAGSKKGTPFEFVAAQALLARWAGIPARIAYGYDRGKQVGSLLEFRPINGSSWLEVYFQGFGWLPITGLPKHAETSIANPDKNQQAADIIPSNDIAVQLFVPLRVAPKGLLFKQIRAIVLIILPIVLLMVIAYFSWPVYLKARRRSKRRQWVLQHGRRARIALAYAELRDMATDLGVGDPYVTPLAYVDKVVPDEEHRELAWLVTRCLWGDLADEVSDEEVFAAEELSRSMRRRLFEAQPFTIRGIAVISRLSLRNPYAPELLSPPVEKFELGKALSRLFKNPFSRISLKKKAPKETVDEAIEIA